MADIYPDRLSIAMREWRLQALQSLGNNARFVREERNGFSVYRQRNSAAEYALDALMPDPDRVFAGARILKNGSRTHAGVVELAGARYVLKRYNCRGWTYRTGNAFRRSRAVRTWLVNWHYLARGIPVPQPLLCLEERRFRLLERSYILMELVDGAVSLRECWKQLVPAEKTCLGKSIGRLLGEMHRTGMLHGDLKWDNILIGSEPSSNSVRLVDLDGSVAVSKISRSRAEKDFARFLKDLDKESAGDALYGSVGTAWERAFGSRLFSE